MHRRALLAAGAAAASPGAGARFAPARRRKNRSTCCWCSRSMSPAPSTRTRRGCSARATAPPCPTRVVVEAIRGGMIGAIGVAYVEWAGAEYQRLVLPWTRIGGQRRRRRLGRDAGGGAARLAVLDLDLRRASTSRTACWREAPFEATRRVIDVSGDGVNNSGGPVEAGARPRGGRGHHHQRPADHERPPDLRPPAARAAGRVLPRERDRRPRRLRHRGRGLPDLRPRGEAQADPRDRRAAGPAHG